MQHSLFGFFGDTVYRMSVKKNALYKVVEPFGSSIFMSENAPDRTLTASVRINTMDFYKEEANEVLYEKMIKFLKISKIKGIDTLYYSLKIGLDYQITDMNGDILDSGIRFIQTDAEEVNVLLDPDPIAVTLPYRKAEYLNKRFEISRIGGKRYGVMDAIPSGIKFKINNITLYANLTDQGSKYYIQNLGPSSQDCTFSYNSGTVKGIYDNSVILFDSRLYGVVFPSQEIRYVPEAIYVSVEALINNFCAVVDDSEIWEIISMNGGYPSESPSEFDDPNYRPGHSPFDPVVNRKPCHGNYPMPPRHPHHRPEPGYRPEPCPRPPYPPIPPAPRPGVVRPIKPGENWNPEGELVPPPDRNQDHGDLNDSEWCLASSYDPENEKFLVVDDNISDEEFDATKMVKYSEVFPYVTDIQIGQYVKKSIVVYY